MIWSIDDLQVVLHLVDPLFPEGAVVLEAGHLVDRVKFFEGLDEGIHVPVVAPVRCRILLEGLRVQDL